MLPPLPAAGRTRGSAAASPHEYSARQALQWLGYPASGISNEVTQLISRRGAVEIPGPTRDARISGEEVLHLLFRRRDQHAEAISYMLAGVTRGQAPAAASAPEQDASEPDSPAPAPAAAVTDLVALREPTQRMQQAYNMLWEILAPSGDRQSFVDGLAMLFGQSPGLLASVIFSKFSSDSLSVVIETVKTSVKKNRFETRVAETPAYFCSSQVKGLLQKQTHMIAGYVQSLTSRQEFLNIKHFAKGVFAGCQITIGDDWPGDATAKKAFLELLPKNLPTFDDASVNEDGTSVGVACDLEELLKVVLGCAGIQKLVGGAGVIVKLVLDAARIVNGENVAVMSISVVLPGMGASSRLVTIQALAFSDDHHADAANHFEVSSLYEVQALEARGLDIEGLRGLEGVESFNLPLYFVMCLDGSAERSTLGLCAAGGFWGVPGVPVSKGNYGRDFLKKFLLDQEQELEELLAAVWPASMGADNANNRRDLARRAFGVMKRNISGLDREHFVVELLHATMNVGKHSLAAVFAVFVALDCADGLKKVLRKRKIRHYIQKSDAGTESLVLTNGTDYQETYNDEFWVELSTVLDAAGFKDEAVCLRYVMSIVTNHCAVVLAAATKSSDWVVVAIAGYAAALAQTMAYNMDLIKPSPFALRARAADFDAFDPAQTDQLLDAVRRDFQAIRKRYYESISTKTPKLFGVNEL